MAELHPAVQRMADKGYERATLDQMAIVNLMRQALDAAQDNAILLKKWLQEENPLQLNGPDLVKWATEVSEWILPTQLRSQRAATTGIEQVSDRQQHQERAPIRQASEASGGHSFTERREGEVPFVTQAGQ